MPQKEILEKKTKTEEAQMILHVLFFEYQYQYDYEYF